MPKDILIIGGGVVGLCCAYYASEAGHAVTLVDRNGPSRDGCSFGNAGMIVPSHFIPLAAPGMVEMGIRMMRDRRSPFHIVPRASRDLWSWGTKFCQSATAEHVARSAPLLRDLNFASRACYIELSERFGGNFGLAQHGLLALCKSPAVFEEEGHVAETARRLGIPAEVLDADEVNQLEPRLTADVAGGVFFPKDCHLDPAAFMVSLQRHLEARGVRFLWRRDVSDIVTHHGRIEAIRVAAAGGGDDAGGETLHADEYVIAGGAWSPILASQVGLDLPMQAGKGYSLTLARPRQQPTICAILTEARVAVTPMGQSLRFAGTMQIAGLDASIDGERVAGIIASVPRYFPAFREEDFAGVRPWSGLRPCSPDGLPYIGRTERATNLVIAAGHAMMGLSLGPITGKLVAQIVSGGRTEMPLGLLSPERFEYV
jgi:D-amino-acid dehydrogenase